MRRWALIPGLLVLACAWLGPLPTLAPQSFFAHMSMHVAVIAVAAPLLAVGLTQSRFDPVRVVPGLFAPIPASLLELAVVLAWHAPALNHAARHSAWAMAVEQSSFLAAGLLVWLAAFGGDPARRTARAGAGIAALLLTSMHMTLLGTLLTLAPRPLFGQDSGPFGMTALEDQQLGGALMLLGAGTAYLIGGLVLLAELLRGQPAAVGRIAPDHREDP